ncbi:MAG: hypothetical protein LUD00_02265 [Prevotellaceae bacterium]|nr:hypothetical protein [Prevotellaceae bacterium]
MKATRTILASIMLFICSAVANAQPMSYYAMRDNARFLTDRMAYTLGVTSAFIIDDLYRINYDYICGVNDYLDDVARGYRYDDYMAVMYERDRALQVLLGANVWARLITYDYFYRPIIFANRGWRFGIYAHDSRHKHFYCKKPRYYKSYRGGHFFAGIRPVGPPPPHNSRPSHSRPAFHYGDKDHNRPGNVTRPRPDDRNRGKVNPGTRNNEHGGKDVRQPARGNDNRDRKSSSNMRSSSRSSSHNVKESRSSSSRSQGSRSDNTVRTNGGRR